MSNIMVCDAIMSSGKSSAAITYMNEHRDQRFIYITPYLDEAERIKEGCPELRFVTPNKNVPGTGFSKTGHIAKLLEEGRNISSTHRAFDYFTEEMLNTVKELGYTLFVDESLSGVEVMNLHLDDLNMLVRAGYIRLNDQKFELVDEGYSGSMYRDIFRTMKSRDLIQCTDEQNNQTLVYWTLPPSLLSSFQNVFILTYLFSGQDIHHMLEMYQMEYRHIGIVIGDDHKYRFSDTSYHMPAYTGRIHDMIHILDNPKLNQIGDGYYDLSVSWYNKNTDKIDHVKNNLYNYYRNMSSGSSAQRMWGVYKDYIPALRGNGYSTKHVTFNERATNKYKDRTDLAYLVNLFMNTGLKNFYAKHGVDANNDDYALSVMVQWIWRSAIRDGKEINLYLPSSRMRRLLMNWMDDVKRQYIACAGRQ